MKWDREVARNHEKSASDLQEITKLTDSLAGHDRNVDREFPVFIAKRWKDGRGGFEPDVSVRR